MSSFSTSEALLDPLALSGELAVSLRGTEESFTPMVRSCPVSPRGPCDAYGDPVTSRILFADVTLPTATGGQGVYKGNLYFSDRTPLRVSASDPTQVELVAGEPHEFQRTWFPVDVTPGETLTLPQELADKGFAYAGCFLFVAWDPAGHVAQTSTCMPRLSPANIRALAGQDLVLPLSNDTAVAADELRQVLTDYGEEVPAQGCSIGRRESANSSWLALLLIGCALGQLRCRRVRGQTSVTAARWRRPHSLGSLLRTSTG